MLHTFEQEKPGCAPGFSALFTELFRHKSFCLQRRYQRLACRAGQRAFLVYAVLADGVGEGRGVLVDRRVASTKALTAVTSALRCSPVTW